MGNSRPLRAEILERALDQKPGRWDVFWAGVVEDLVDEIHAELGCGHRGCLYCSRLGYSGGGE